MPVTADPQHSIYEKTIEDASLEAALEHRTELKEEAKKAGKAYRDADAVVRDQLGKIDLGVGAPVRIGNYVVTVKETAGKSVSFETAPGTRLQISLLAE